MIQVLHGDCRTHMAAHGPFDMILADPPYGDTSLAWDRRVNGWQSVARDRLLPSGSLWVFGSMRFFMNETQAITMAGFRYAQDIVWEKHNGSGFHADRFKRVHEHAVQFYRDDTAWGVVYNDVQKTMDAVQRTVNRKKGRPAHMGHGHIEQAPFASVDGGPRVMRSVIPMRSCHGEAIHPTEKPVGLLEILIRTSCPDGGLVGDFFAGSGAVGEACAHTGRRYLGCEIDQEMAAKATYRLDRNLFATQAGAAL
jgi:site-specific DNA-methyltransferase (adenine-specific)